MSKLAAIAATALLVLAGTPALAQGSAQAALRSPVGLWKTIDDETGKAKSLIRIRESQGVLSGTVEKLIDPAEPNPRCDKCSDARKDQPVIGMTVMQGVRREGEDWGGGEILDPNNGKTYRVRLRLIDGGTRLEVRGYLGIALFGRSQTWLREP
jgi:uncharacterized protein (DUF2147 family)